MLISTSDDSITTSLQEALFFCQPNKDSLWTFKHIPQISIEVITSFKNKSFVEISTIILNKLINQNEIIIPLNELKKIVEGAYNFPIEIHSVSKEIHFLELTHGNTVTFKDFGARILAGLILYFKNDNSRLRILVATSGDTGSAIAAAFYKVENIECHILFPKGKISKIQKQQITSYGDNIFCYETDNNFDTCQSWVKRAFDDFTINSRLQITSANSINIGRLLGQISYYFYAYSRINILETEKFIVSIPSGNLGNLTGCVVAMKMGLPIYKIMVACNSNGTLKEYLEMGISTRAICQYTYSNAMDIIKPSNIKRVVKFFQEKYYTMKNNLESTNINNTKTLDYILEVYEKYNYLVDPHTAIGYGGCQFMRQKYSSLKTHYLIVSTAAPIKFQEIIAKVLPNITVEIPKQLLPYLENEMKYEPIPNNYNYWKYRFITNCKIDLSNIVLIGMPGSGKSTIGKLLSQQLNKKFIDLDVKIEDKYNLTLIEIIDKYGNFGFNKIEEEVYFENKEENIILSPGGSIIYYPEVMEDIISRSVVVFLDVNIYQLQKRLGDFKQRGIVFPEGVNLYTLYKSRLPKYKKYADIIINSTGLNEQETINKIINILEFGNNL